MPDDESPTQPVLTPERWREIGALVDAALELPPERRAAFLESTCADPRLRAEVERLIESCENSGEFLERSAGELAAPLFASQRKREFEDMLPQLRSALAERFEVERELGHGASAIVYLARDVRHGRRVAIKVLRAELAAALGAGRFLREIETLARLTHPHIVPLLESGEIDGRPYYIMPHVEGESLRTRLVREQQLPVGDAVRIAREVAGALGYAHRQNVLHRDLKPENILFSDGQAVVADFGIARAIVRAVGAERGESTAETLTATGFSLGTPAYMSPEQAAGDRTIDSRSDIYALGCLLYEMLGGRPPFTGPTVESVIRQHLLTPPTDVSVLRDDIPSGLAAAVMRALAKTRSERFASMEEFAGALVADTTATRVADYSPFRGGAAAWSRTLPFASVAIVLTLILWILLAKGDRLGGGNSVPAQPTRVAVFPFRVDDPALSHLSDGLMALLSDAIDGAGAITRVDPNAIMREVAQNGGASALDLERASAVAGTLGAGRFLLGRVVPTGGSVQLLASLYLGPRPAEPERTFRYHGSVDSLPALIAALARDVLLRIPTGPGTWVTDSSAPITASAAALKEYMRGETFLRQGRADSAAAAFRAASALDSTFALAWLRLSFAEAMRIQDSAMVAASDRAILLANRLSPRDRLLAEAVHRHSHGDGAGSERAALALTSAYPEYAEGWYRLGITRFWYAWQTGDAPDTAEPAFERAVAIDPAHAQALLTLSWLAVLSGRHERLDSLIRARGRLPWRIPNQASAFPDYLNATRTARTADVINIANDGAWNSFDRLVDAERVANLLTDTSTRSASDVMIGHVLRARIAVAAGRWTDAESAYRKADDAGFGLGLLESSWVAAVPASGASTARMYALRDSLRRWAPVSGLYTAQQIRSTFYFPGLFALDGWFLPHVRRYVLGLLSAGLHDEPAALRYARELELAKEPNDSVGLLSDLAREIKALLALQRGDATSTLSILDGGPMRVASSYQISSSPFHMRPVSRLLRGEALVAAGRYEEALGWFAGIGWARDPPELVFLASANRRLGEIYERLGNHERAAYHYGRFVARWQYADSVHQPDVAAGRQKLDQARARLAKRPPR